MKIDLVFITDIEHSAPRISNFISNLKEDKDFNIVLIGADYNKVLNSNDLPINFNDNITHFLFNRKFDIVSKLRLFYRKNILDSTNTPRVINSINIDRKSTKFIKIKNALVKTLLSFYIPDQYIFELNQYIFQFKKYLKNSDNKIILVSSSPYSTCHIASSIIKKRYKSKSITWIADYRDLWSLNHNYPFSNFRKLIDKNIELYFLKNCDFLTTVSLQLSNQISEFLNKKTFVIPNGFSNIIFDNNQNLFFEKKINTTYFLHVGSIYFDKQDVNLLFDSLSQKNNFSNSGRIELHFSGDYSEKLEMMIRKYKLQDFVKQIGKFNRKDSIKMQFKYDYLFYFDWNGNDGVLPLKFYEYINSNRPIIAIGNSPSSSTALILKKINRGLYLTNINEISNIFFNNDIRMKMCENFCYNEADNYEFSYKYQANKFATILKEISINNLNKFS